MQFLLYTPGRKTKTPDPFVFPRRLREKVEVIGPEVDLERLNTSISIAIADRIGTSWDESYGRLKAYKQQEGHCRVPHRYCDPDSGYRLGQWVSLQRSAQEKLSIERYQRLYALGFAWGVPRVSSWEDGFRSLEIFRQREGHCRVPSGYCDPVSGFRLRQWVKVQRGNKDTMSPDRRARLDALGFAWDALAAQWEEGFRSLECFRQREGHCRVPYSHREQGFRLGPWVHQQRTDKDRMSPNRRQRLDALRFVWKVR